MRDRTLWFAIAVSTLLFGVLAYATERNYTLQPFSIALRRPVVVVLYAIASAVFFWTIGISRRGRSLERTARPGIAASSQSRFVVRLVLFEAVAAIGLVAAFVDHDWRIYLPAWGLALFGLVRTYP